MLSDGVIHNVIIRVCQGGSSSVGRASAFQAGCREFESRLPLQIVQVRGFAPIGMVECWNIGKMGLGILQYWVNGKIRLDDKV